MRNRVDLSSERGASLVLVVLMLPVLLVFGTFAIDAANLWVHKRHLQVQADAGALAGADKLQNVGCNNSAIDTLAQQYAGTGTNAFNGQIGGTSKGTVGFAYTNNVLPCAGTPKAVDVTLTESGVPWFVRIASLFGINTSSTVRARARVELQQLQQTGGGTIPAALEDERIRAVRAVFVDESKATTDPGYILGTRDLVKESTDGSGGAVWGNSTTPWAHNVTEANIGVRFIVAYGTSFTCGDPSVDCLDKGSDNGILQIHGFEQAGAVPTNGAPRLRNVTIAPSATNGCTGNGYFNPGGCNVDVYATADFNSSVNPAPSSNQGFITAQVGTATGALTYNTTSQKWVGTFAVPAASGPLDVLLRWEQDTGQVSATQKCGNNKGNPKVPQCFGVFKGDQATGVYTGQTATYAGATAVHRTFTSSVARSGAARYADVMEGATITNSVPRCATGVTTCNHNFSVHIGLPGDLALGGKLVFSTDQSQSNDYILSCGTSGASGVQTTFGTGCPYAMKENGGEACPAWSSYPAGVPEPWTCVPSFPGGATQEPARGLSQRVYGTQNPNNGDCAAHPNNWPNWQTNPNDPRIVQMLLVKHAQLDTNGRGVFPIEAFATVYLTGWNGNGGSGVCTGSFTGANESTPVKTFTGYFISYVHPNDGSTVGDGPCTGTELDACVPVMTE